ncbi:signal peptidase I [Coprothermobacter platensis]|uniref:signal peptidase I n=1 Tax=Coprothermobacter platensis TaxID=108819 RepID=UPI000374A5B6|nr:signal peptidase I [Coprothermobacter platensis]
MPRKFLGEIFEWIIAIVLAAAIVIPLRVYVLQPYKVYMTSMVPTFEPGDVVIGLKSTVAGKIERGDVVIVGGPFSNNELYIKRVIGLPGEIISISNGVVYINGSPLAEPWLPSDALNASGEMPPTKLSNDQYFVMGDNRIASRDSRAFGPVTKQEVKAKVVLRIYPLDKIRSF